MSETPHIDFERDARLAAIYRAAAQDAPPPALDAAILAAARREVGARPRPAGFSFGYSWRTSLSIAAVMVLSVSLVTLMREEAPELTAPPSAESPAADAKVKAAASADAIAVPAERGLLREEQKSKNIGLRPPQAGAPSGLGIRQSEFAEDAPRSKKDAVERKPEADAAGPAQFAKRRDAFSGAADLRDKQIAASSEPRQAVKTDALRENAQAPAAVPPAKEFARPARAAEPAAERAAPFPAAGAVAGAAADENKPQIRRDADRAEPESRLRAQSNYAPAKQAAEAQPPSLAMAKPEAAPAAKPAAPPALITLSPSPAPAMAQAKSAPAMGKLERGVDLAPEKWLERIEELRKSGKLEEAKTSLAEFRKRYPDYRLPDSLRNWPKP